tara:strand:- start:2241 stop:3587 length:1347 start_codon:yes stop_codon:yes gene_type:complete
MSGYNLDPCILAIANICGNDTFTEDAVPQIVRVVGKMLEATNYPLPPRVIESLCRMCFKTEILSRFDTSVLFRTKIRPDPLDFGIEQPTLLPLLFDVEFSQGQQGLWTSKVEELKLVPQHAQRSEEWYAQRNGSVTASDFATAIGESKYDKPEDLLLKKCDRGVPFTGNKFTRHGQRFEDAAVYLYEKMYNRKIIEFGLMPHGVIKSHSRKQQKVVAASPDGISENGIMLEIKCPFTRKIEHYHPTIQGITDGDKTIVPHGYYCQMQSQLECCDLEICDFMECNIQEFETSKQYYDDSHESCLYKTAKGKIKSCIIEFRKIDTEDISIHVEYPPDIYMTGKDLQKWMKTTIKKVQTATLKFERPIYYWVEDVAIYRVYRDRQFFDSRLPKIKAFWKRVEEARKDPSILDEIEKTHKPRKQMTGSWKKKQKVEDAVMKLCQAGCLLDDD